MPYVCEVRTNMHMLRPSCANWLSSIPEITLYSWWMCARSKACVHFGRIVDYVWVLILNMYCTHSRRVFHTNTHEHARNNGWLHAWHHLHFTGALCTRIHKPIHGCCWGFVWFYGFSLICIILWPSWFGSFAFFLLIARVYECVVGRGTMLLLRFLAGLIVARWHVQFFEERKWWFHPNPLWERIRMWILYSSIKFDTMPLNSLFAHFPLSVTSFLHVWWWWCCCQGYDGTYVGRWLGGMMHLTTMKPLQNLL